MTLIIDTASLIGGGILLLLVLAATLTDVFLRKSRRTENPLVVHDMEEVQTTNEDHEADEVKEMAEASYDYPPVSIIVTPHDKAYELDQHLPLLLEQDYPAPFRIIVVFWRGESDTDDVLKKYAANPHLYATYIPDSSRYMSRKKLAITVGEKAATTEWLLLTDVTCRPQSKYWLRAMARHATQERNLVIGHTRFDDDTPPFRRFLRSYTSLYLQQELARGTAYRCEGNALMLRRSEFEKRDGFRANLKYLRGEYDFIVNEYARPGATAFENSEDGTLLELCPTDKAWRNKLLYYMEDRRHMARTAAHRWRHNLAQTLLHLSVVALLASVLWGCLTARWILVAWTVLLLAATVGLHTWICLRALRSMDEDQPASRLFLYEMRLLWHYLAFHIRYHRANKDDFITHKI